MKIWDMNFWRCLAFAEQAMAWKIQRRKAEELWKQRTEPVSWNRRSNGC
jgi:hypothetical protein